jgi:hypothetical protein
MKAHITQNGIIEAPIEAAVGTGYSFSAVKLLSGMTLHVI